MINTVNISKAYSEVYELINILGEEYRKKLPDKIYMNIKNNRDMNFKPKYEVNMKIDKQTFSHEALALISALNLQYWCENENRKKELKEAYIKNTKKEEEKYSYENLFKNNNVMDVEEKEIDSEIQMIEYKENIFKKIINKIKSLLHLN